MRLWIAEKPDMGRKIAKALGGGKEQGGAIDVGGGEIVTWAIGHLLESCMPDEYDPKYKKWNLEDLPIIPERFKNKPQEGKTAQLRVVTGLIKKAKSVVVATDAGREGEAIAWALLDHAGWKGKCERLWTSSLGDDHLKKAVRQLIDDSDKKALYIAAKLRSAMDWCDGINLSRAYNIRISNYGDAVLSLGRVQTATLAILVDRDNEIANFRPSDYFELKADMSTPAGKLELLHKRPEEKRIKDKAEADAIAAQARNQNTKLKVENKAVTMRPPPPFSLPELQMAASARWGWGAKKTLDVLQKLYEAGIVTYPRTDAGCLTEDMIPTMPKHLAALKKHPDFKQFADITPEIRKTVFDNKKVEDHHGIIPTDEPSNWSAMDADGTKLFDIIARRFLAALMPDAKASRTNISATLGGHVFKTSGTIINFPGWKAVWDKDGDPSEKKTKDDDDDDSNRKLPPVKNGDSAHSDAVTVLTKTTRPPPNYTEGTLLKAMINAGSASEDTEIRDLLSGGGLGTQATRQEIIEKLKFRQFAEIKGKKILSTNRAREFIAILRDEGSRLADVKSTADLERRLRAVEKDPSTMPKIWHAYARMLRAEIETLKATPPRRKLTPSPRKPGGSYAKKSAPKKGGYKGKRAPAGKPKKTAYAKRK